MALVLTLSATEAFHVTRCESRKHLMHKKMLAIKLSYKAHETHTGYH